MEAALALAVVQTGDVGRAAVLVDRARATVAAGGEHWAIAAVSLLGAQIAVAAGDVSLVATMAADAHRHAEATDFDAFRVPASLLEAWVAERRGDSDAATRAYRRVVDLANRAGFADHTAFALSALASHALASGEMARAEGLERRALATAEAARAAWTAAHARVALGRILTMAGDTETAATYP